MEAAPGEEISLPHLQFLGVASSFGCLAFLSVLLSSLVQGLPPTACVGTALAAAASVRSYTNLRKCLQQPGLVWGQSQEPRTHSRSPTWGAGSQLLEPSRLPPRFALTGSWNLATFTCDMGVNSKAICPLRALPYPFKNKLWRRQCH